jgi:hypothetical protein
MTRTFGFRVSRANDGWVGDTWVGLENDTRDLWSVQLPHQCDSWEIVGADEWDGTAEHTDAVSRLEDFISEATRALESLRARCEFDTEKNW